MIIEQFVQHNKYVLITILWEWLTPEEFISFDSAVTNVALRNAFHEVVTQHSSFFQAFLLKKDAVPLSFGMMQWARKRKFNLILLPKLKLTNSTLLQIHQLSVDDRNWLFSFAFNAEQVTTDRCCDDSIFANILTFCENLKSVKITNSTSTAVGSVINRCSILSKCDLSGCRSLSESIMMQLCRSCLLLRDLNVVDCHDLASPFMRCITVHCPMLVNLKVNGCYRITRRDWFMFYMQFRGLLESVDCVSALTDFHVRILSCYRGNTLKKLTVGAAQHLHDQSVVLLAVACDKLTELDLSGCRALTSAGMLRFAGYTKTLTKLWLKNVSIDDEGLLLLLENNPNITVLAVSNNILTAESLVEIGARCPNMTTLTMINIMLPEDDFINVILKCKKLVNVCIDSNTLLTDNAFAAIVVCCRDIKTISASCNRLSDLSLYAFAQHCHNLTQLDVNHCYEVTDKGLSVLLEWCRNLVDLRITNCGKITGTTLQKCTKYSSYLSVLRTSIKTKNMTVVSTMIEKLKRLRYFSMYLLVDDLMALSRHAMEVNPDLRIAVYDE